MCNSTSSDDGDCLIHKRKCGSEADFIVRARIGELVLQGGWQGITRLLYSVLSFAQALEWRNWQTHGTQNPATFTGHVGSTPTSSTIVHQ